MFLFSSPRFPPLPSPRLPLGGTGTGGSSGLLHTRSHPLARRRSSFLESGRMLHQVFSEQGPGGSGLTDHPNFCFLNLFDFFGPCCGFLEVGHTGLSLQRLLLCSVDSRAPWVSAVVTHGLTCSSERGISPPDRGSNPCLLHRQDGSSPLGPPGKPLSDHLHHRRGEGRLPKDGTRSFPKSTQISYQVSPLISVQFSRSVVSDSLRPHGPQHARPPCPSPTPGVYSNSCPSSR